MRINGTLQTPEARKDMLACLFYLKESSSGIWAAVPEARVLYREARKDCLLVFSI